jgi:hypothetical protein
MGNIGLSFAFDLLGEVNTPENPYVVAAENGFITCPNPDHGGIYGLQGHFYVC